MFDNTETSLPNFDQQTLYDSGDAYVLEHLDIRFTFSEHDFAERCELAARELGFTNRFLDSAEREDLVTLVLNGEVRSPASPLGAYTNRNYDLLYSADKRSLTHWLRRVIFRGTWLDYLVRENELDIKFCSATGDFTYLQKNSEDRKLELDANPSWLSVSYC